MTDPAQYINGRTVEEQMNSLITYVDTRSAEVATDAIASDMATLSQAVADAESAKDDAEAARDTAVSTVSDCVKMHPGALQVIRDYPLQSVAGFVGSLVGNATTATSASTANTATTAATATKLGSSTVGSTVKPIYLNGGTATVCSEMCDLASTQTVIGAKTFSSVIKGTTPGSGASTSSIPTIAWTALTDGTNNLVHTNSDEDIKGVKTFAKPVGSAYHESGSNNSYGWRKLLVSPSFASASDYAIGVVDIADNTAAYGRFSFVGYNGTLVNFVKVCGNFNTSRVKLSIDSNKEVIIWTYDFRAVASLAFEVHSGTNAVSFTDSGTTTTFNEPTVGDYTQVITAS